MTLFNSANPRIAAAQGDVIETLMSIPDEYGAVFVIDDLQAELRAAVLAHHQKNVVLAKAKTLAAPGRRGRRKHIGNVVDMTGKRVA